MIDSHAHLEMASFDRDRDAVVARAAVAGVDTIVTVGTHLAECRKAVILTDKYKGLFAAVGIHPHEAQDFDKETADALRRLCKNRKVVAYGEIGLDFFRDLSPRDIQMEVFAAQLGLASELDLPVIIHDREAHRQTLAVIRDWQGKRGGVFHCFSGDVAMAEKCLSMGFYISIAGPITYPRSEKLREVARMVPLDRLLIETDCPYLTPQPQRGRRNEPALMVHTAKEVAAVRGLTLEEIAAATADNAKRLFRIP